MIVSTSTKQSLLQRGLWKIQWIGCRKALEMNPIKEKIGVIWGIERREVIHE